MLLTLDFACSSREATNTNFIVFDLTRPSSNPRCRYHPHFIVSVTCSGHDIPEDIAHLALNNIPSLTHSFTHRSLYSVILSIILFSDVRLKSSRPLKLEGFEVVGAQEREILISPHIITTL
jgi:hypothetical protein